MVAKSLSQEDSFPTLTRAGLSEIVQQELGIKHRCAEALVEDVIGQVCEALARGENVKIMNFATFELRSKNGRIGRNPKNGVEVPIPPLRTVMFKPSEGLRARIARKEAP